MTDTFMQANVDAKTAAARSLLVRLLNHSITGSVMLSPEQASHLLNGLNFPKQRPIKEARVQAKLADLEAGEWEENHGITFVQLPDGSFFLVDGQHRLTAISRWTAPVALTIRVARKADMREAQRFYATFDSQSSVRSTRELLDAVGLPDELGLSKTAAKAVYDAAQLLMNELQPVAGSANVARYHEFFRMSNRLEVVQKWAQEAKEYEAIIAKAHHSVRKLLRGTGVLAVALVTLRYQPSTAREFWLGVAENDGLRKNDPRATFLTDLLSRSKGSGSVRQRVQQPAVAWNAYYEDRDLKIIKCVPGNDIVLAGTPFDGKGGL